MTFMSLRSVGAMIDITAVRKQHLRTGYQHDIGIQIRPRGREYYRCRRIYLRTRRSAVKMPNVPPRSRIDFRI